MSCSLLEKSPLGQKIQYTSHYSPSLLFAVSRSVNREEIGVKDPLPFDGVDIWNAYELSWLDASSLKPRIAMAEFYFPCRSANLIESKSLKLYLNSFNQSSFKTETEVKTTLQNDLSALAGSPVKINLFLPPFDLLNPTREFSGICLDDLPVQITTFTPEPHFLSTEHEVVQEELYSRLLKTNCPVTGQPDWGSVYIRYQGKKINHLGLLQYLISFREHNDFHEHCVERIFMDVMRRCHPEQLTVYARYTRRGGLDINPFRSNFQSMPINFRNNRQ